ncbi:MAG: DUF1501 domain-containing protein [Acidiferrobacterales bacterium]|nr:DUF1501 domain-containing protein [Acidiferrobacterales bacterium]
MKKNNTNNYLDADRRAFLKSALYSAAAYGAGMMPATLSSANATPAQLSDRVLIDLFLNGGPDMRHLIVPEPSSTFGQKYWANRQRSHNLAEYGQSVQQRWNDDYYPITVGNSAHNWTNSLVDIGGQNSGVTFGIWKEAGWLIDMFRAGNVALIFNCVGGTNRAHDLSSLMLHQGNVLSGLNDANRSGWGGRLARSAGGNCVGLTSTPSPFTFGPLGNATNYDPNVIDNSELITVKNSREIGLYEAEFRDLQFSYWNSWREKMSRSAKSYYSALQNETLPNVYDKTLQHEKNVRNFGKLIQSRLETVPLPDLIQALYAYEGVTIGGIPVNPEPDPGEARYGLARPVLRSTYHFGPQIRNAYDILAVSDLEEYANSNFPGEFAGFQFRPRVMSMIYNNWDTHSQQRPYQSVLSSDPHNPYVNRGIENGFRDIFGGKFGSSPAYGASLHGGFSALWNELSTNTRQNLVITVAGEFGRQIRDNGDHGTDHGSGNLMMVISENCNGGLYGNMFPSSEITKYDEPIENTPDIDPQTEIDHIFARVSEWVHSGSGADVFPRIASGYSGSQPIIEMTGMFNNLFST